MEMPPVPTPVPLVQNDKRQAQYIRPSNPNKINLLDSYASDAQLAIEDRYREQLDELIDEFQNIIVKEGIPIKNFIPQKQIGTLTEANFKNNNVYIVKYKSGKFIRYKIDWTAGKITYTGKDRHPQIVHPEGIWPILLVPINNKDVVKKQEYIEEKNGTLTKVFRTKSGLPYVLDNEGGQVFIFDRSLIITK